MKFTAPICAIITISIFFLQEKYTTTTTIQPHLKSPSFTNNDIVFFFVKEGSSNFLSNAKSLEKNLYTSWRDGQVGYVVMWVQKSPQNNIFFILPP